MRAYILVRCRLPALVIKRTKLKKDGLKALILLCCAVSKRKRLGLCLQVFFVMLIMFTMLRRYGDHVKFLHAHQTWRTATTQRRDYLENLPRRDLRKAVFDFLGSRAVMKDSGSMSLRSNLSTLRSSHAAVRPLRHLTSRQDAVRNATRRVWDAYEKYAMGFDELLPVSGEGVQTFGRGMGLTIVDSLDTLYLMGGLDGRFDRARAWVDKHLRFDFHERVSVFETVIRVLGGLVSTYCLTGDKMFADRAEELGARLTLAFDTPHMLPCSRLSLVDGTCATYIDRLHLAEVGTLLLEFRALAAISNSTVIQAGKFLAESAVKTIQRAPSDHPRPNGKYSALLPRALSMRRGVFISDTFTIGGSSDSYFEYLVKTWIQGGKREDEYWIQFQHVIDSIAALATVRAESGHVGIADLIFRRGGYVHRFMRHQHLMCFLPGSIILGLQGLNSDDKQRRETWEWLAASLTETCHKMYSTRTGLSGEYLQFTSSGDIVHSGDYNVRPEAVEAMFYMYRHTGNEKYRDWAWEIFEAMEKHSQTHIGAYSIVSGPGDVNTSQMNTGMPSFAIAETLKYLYLLFGDDDVELPLTTWVFNTEGHPLPVFSPRSYES